MATFLKIFVAVLFAWQHFGLAAALVQLDDLEAAKAAVQQTLALDPYINLSRLRAKLLFMYSTLDDKSELLLNSLLRAGMPEG
jgi:hypothetical protein